MMEVIKFFCKKPHLFFVAFLSKFGKHLPDKLYLQLLYFFSMGTCLHLKNPKRFTEKIQWLKIYDYKDCYSKLVDKQAVKEYVGSIIGDEYIIPTIGVWDNSIDIDFETLPNQFVLKTTHGGGGCGVVVCNNKATIDKSKVLKKLDKSMNTNAGYTYREKPYLNVERKIIAEEYIRTDDNDLKDYKFFCFNGKVKFFKIDFGRFVEHHANYYDIHGNILPFGEVGLEPDASSFDKIPDNLSEMIQIAEKLSENFRFLRVDLYNVNGTILFGELTFYPAGGVGKFTPDEWDFKIGDYLRID